MPIALGGTGATNATSARSTLGLGSIATQDSDDINITGGSIIDITDIAIADGGTGASTASGARTNLGLVIGTDIQAFGSNLDDISDLTVSDGNFIVGNGTKFITESGSTARNSLGLGSIATQNSNNVSVTGGSITNITDLAVGDGGTGSSTTSGARSNLGLAIGSDVQAYDAELAAVAGLTSAADKGIQFTGSGSAATYDLTSAGKALLDDANSAAQRTTLGVDVAGTDNSTNVTLATVTDNYLSLSGQEVTVGTVPISLGGTGATTASAALQNLGLTSTAAELNILDGVTATATELNLIDGVTATTTELNYIDGVTSNIQTQLDAKNATISGAATTIATSDLTASRALTSNGSGKVAVSDVTSTELSVLDGITSTTAELNILDGVTSTATELNILDGVTSTTAELNILDGGTSATSTTVADADRLVVNDNGTMVQVAVTDLKTYVHTNTSINDLSDGTANTTNFSNSILLGQSSTGTLNSAEYNVGLGYGVFDALTTGDRNMGVGYNALNRVTGGSGNVAIGGQSLTAVTTGDRNVAIGRQSGRDVDDGELANGADLTTGDENTYLGAWTQPSAADVQNETVIGSESTGQGSNTVTIGNAAVTQVYLSQDKGATVFAGALDVTASGGITLENDETITNATDGTVAITATTTSVSGDLTVTGNDVTFGNGETISNATDGTVEITATNTTVSGNLSGSGSISGFDANLNDQTGTTYTLTSSDNGKVVTLNNGSAITLTIAASLGDGFNCLIVQKGAGQVTLSAATGVTIANRSSETKTAGQYATVSVINIGSDTYILSGDTGT